MDTVPHTTDSIDDRGLARCSHCGSTAIHGRQHDPAALRCLNCGHQPDGAPLPQRCEPPGSLGTRWGCAALAGITDEIERAPRSARHATFHGQALRAGSLIGGRELLNETAVVAAIEDAGRVLGLPESYVRRTARKAIERGKANPRKAPETFGMTRAASRAEVVTHLVRWWTEVVREPERRGRTAGTVLSILAALFLAGITSGKLTLKMSYREVAEGSGVSVGTISKRCSDLTPYIRIVRPGSRERLEDCRTVWRFRLTGSAESVSQKETGRRPSPAGLRPCLFPNATTPIVPDLPGVVGPLNPAFDLWHRWSNGWRIYRCLEGNTQVSVGEIVGSTGLHRSTVYRGLARLEAEGLARRTDDGGWLREAIEVPENDGFTVLAKRRQRHAIERENYRAWYHQRIDSGEFDADAATGEVTARPFRRRIRAAGGARPVPTGGSERERFAKVLASLRRSVERVA